MEKFANGENNGEYRTLEINKIAWRELLFGTLFAVASSLLRTSRLIDSTARESTALAVFPVALRVRAPFWKAGAIVLMPWRN